MTFPRPFVLRFLSLLIVFVSATAASKPRGSIQPLQTQAAALRNAFPVTVGPKTKGDYLYLGPRPWTEAGGLPA
jgi:hypothetical protein